MRTSRSRIIRLFASCAFVWLLTAWNGSLFAADLSEQEVKEAIKRGTDYLVAAQQFDGHWSSAVGSEWTVGITSLAVLGLINSGMSPDAPPVRKGMQYLRAKQFDDLSSGSETYETSLWIMALVGARNRDDFTKISMLAQRLEDGQLTKGNVGGWGYGLGHGREGADQSNTQFAILGLREAVEAGHLVSRSTWERAEEYWKNSQSAEGGWGYAPSGGRPPGIGSMTVAGIASMSIIQQMLKADQGVAADGTPPCCDEPEVDQSLQRGLNWLGNHFSVLSNPGTNSSSMYYIYGIERAGRLSGRRFFGRHDWYREGADYLLRRQQVDGHWKGDGIGEQNNPVLPTCFSLLFLSKGLAPVLINKLKYGKRNPNNLEELFDNDWNRHPRDVRNLTELICSLPKWPKLLTTQELDLAKAVKSGGVNSLLQASVLFITGPKSQEFTADEIKLLKEYLEEGGFIFACPTCHSDEFEPGFRELVTKLMPPGEGELKLLPADHPVYRSEHPLQPDGVKLYGVDFGCRTSIIYSPEDLGCLWDYWLQKDPPDRNVQLVAKIIRATRIGVNVMAYATMRQPPDKTQIREVVGTSTDLDNIERGLLQIAQIKHEGAWNTAPRALRNLLLSLNENVGLSASTKIRDLTLDDKNIFRYPILYMHGRNRFTMSADERQLMLRYLERGGVLFADSCCGAKPFDKSFRDFLTQLYPDRKLERIPTTHEIFSDTVGREIKTLRRRTSEVGDNGPVGSYTIRPAEPFLEGIELEGRYAVIYSKYDISCALERQNSGNCEGYIPEDAVILGTNIVRYAMLQNLRLNK